MGGVGGPPRLPWAPRGHSSRGTAHRNNSMWFAEGSAGQLGEPDRICFASKNRNKLSPTVDQVTGSDHIGTGTPVQVAKLMGSAMP